MQIFLVAVPITQGHNNIALITLRTLWLGFWQFALSHTVRPIAEIFVTSTAQFAGENISHAFASLAGLCAALPSFCARIKFAESSRHSAR